MAKGKTQKYYDANPAANKRRIAQQTRYNKQGPGNEIARKATALNRKLGTYGNGDGKDASHNKDGPGKHGTENASTNRARPRKNKNKSKLYIT
tara:strand:+ start:1091 stop:1369 length:279 start_codon:yes stop_codon:yes gene_type:complete